VTGDQHPGLTWQDLVKAYATVGDATRPWKPLIGTVQLRVTDYTNNGQAYVMRPAEPFAELGLVVIMGSEDRQLFTGISDAELAAIIIWMMAGTADGGHA
jgi:hypothetical protein